MCHRKGLKKDITAVVNNEVVFLRQGTTIEKLLADREIKNRESVWVNENQILPAEYSTFVLQEGDEVKYL
jgi:hypothetical protein